MQEEKPLLFLSVDAEVTFNQIQKWDTAQDLKSSAFINNKSEPVEVLVDKRTIAVVKPLLLEVNVHTEWIDGEGAYNKVRDNAVRKMLVGLKDHLRLKPSGVAKLVGQLDVREVEGCPGRWYLHQHAGPSRTCLKSQQLQGITTP
jgi:hypothetical protein